MSSFLQKNSKILLLLLMVAGLTSCGAEIRETFDLSQARVTVMKGDRQKLRSMKQIQLLIAAPSALKILDGQDIIIDRRGSLSYLKGAQFGDRLPNMLQARLAQAFEDTGRLGGVSRPGDGLAINYQILSDIRSFAVKESNITDALQAHIEIGIKIVDDRNGQVRAARVFESSKPVLGNNNQAYAQGLEHALANILVQIVNWAFDHI